MYLELNNLCYRVNRECEKRHIPPVSPEQVSIVLDVASGKETVTLTQARARIARWKEKTK